MHPSESPFVQSEKSSANVIIPGVAAIAVAFLYSLLFSGSAFIDHARAVVRREYMQAVLVALCIGGVTGAVFAGRLFDLARGRIFLTRGFAGCAAAALLTLAARYEALVMIVALGVGFSTGWMMVSLSLCLRPTLHFNRLGTWCGLGVGLAYAFCNQPIVFEATVTQKTVMAVVIGAMGVVASLRMRASPARPSSLPDYDFRAATGWIVVLFVLVFLDTFVFYILQNSLALKRLSWETPLVMMGNSFVHLCAAVIAGLILDQRRAGAATLGALILLLLSCVLLGLEIDNFPKARILYVAAVSVYSTVLLYLPARGGRPHFAGTVFALSGWIGSGLALSSAMAVEARQVPVGIIVFALVVGVSALFARLLWIKRAEEIESERMVIRRAP